MSWKCGICTFENLATFQVCQVCLQGKKPARSGMWSCSHCTYENAINVNNCVMCAKPKPESPNNHAHKPPAQQPRPVPQPSIPIRPGPAGPFVDSAPTTNPRPFPGIAPHSYQAQPMRPNQPPQIFPPQQRPQQGFPHPPHRSREDAPRHKPPISFPQAVTKPPKHSDVDISPEKPDQVVQPAKKPQSWDPFAKSEILDPDPVQKPNKNDHFNLDDIGDELDEIDVYANDDHVQSAPKENPFESTEMKQKISSVDDEATMALIRQMMAAEQCAVCKKNQGYDVCGVHNVCEECALNHLRNGIETKRWEKEPIGCPAAGCKENFPNHLLRKVGCKEKEIAKIEKMQESLSLGDCQIIECPKCHLKFMGEQANINEARQKSYKELGLDRKELSPEAVKHKAEWRFRCTGCQTIFCGNCNEQPYHLGFTCDGFKEYATAAKCRFCEAQLKNDNLAPFMEGEGLTWCCREDECLTKRNISCDKILKCGHLCRGIRGERQCPPCLNVDCIASREDTNEEDYCNICWVEGLGQAPCVKLECRHYFHYNCIRTIIEKGWPSARITFKFMECPLCNQQISHPALKRILKQSIDLKKDVSARALGRLKIEGLNNDKRISQKGTKYYNNPQQFALDRLAYYSCYKCRKPYYGGMRRCEEAGMQKDEKYKKEHLICGACASGPNTQACKIHGKQYITFKCKYCCNVANWFCWGNTHFCTSCHKRQEQGDYLNRKPVSALPKCPGPDKCPLGIDHPPNGVAEFSLGCVVCLRR